MKRRKDALKINDNYIKFENDSIIDDEDSNDELPEDNDVEQQVEETSLMKRKRLAKTFFDSLSFKNQESDYDATSEFLKDNRLKSKRLSFSDVASKYSDNNLNFMRQDISVKKPLTSVALSNDDSYAVTGSKDGSVIKWCTHTQSKTYLRNNYRTSGDFGTESNNSINSVALLDEKSLIASAGNDKYIRIYDFRTRHGEICKLEGHRDAVTCLSFRKDGQSLLSGSMDRCIKVWDLREMSITETMFGHQDSVTSIDAGNSNSPLSGSLDRSVRSWNLTDESHSVYRSRFSSIECVKALTNDLFVSGGQDGNLSLWTYGQRKPIFTLPMCHGFDGISNVPNWITALSSVHMSNLVVSGACDGFIRLWKINETSRTVELVSTIEALGFVNGIAMSPNIVVSVTGREHRLGRWKVFKGNRNKLSIMRLKNK